MNWESLIKDRMRPASHVSSVEDPVLRNQRRRQKLWRDRNNYNSKYYFTHKAERRKSADEWKRNHRERVNEYAREYRAKHKDSPEYKAKRAAYNRAYRLRQKLKQQKETK